MGCKTTWLHRERDLPIPTRGRFAHRGESAPTRFVFDRDDGDSGHRIHGACRGRFVVFVWLAQFHGHGQLTSRDLRHVTEVVRYEIDDDSKRLVLTNGVAGFSIDYVWTAATRTLTCVKTDQPQVVCLRDCDSWDAQFFQGTPQASGIQPFLAATNSAGALDLGTARVVGLSWKCSRPVVGSSVKTESAQTVRVVLRNLQQ
jgi:hypothetical protein